MKKSLMAERFVADRVNERIDYANSIRNPLARDCYLLFQLAVLPVVFTADTIIGYVRARKTEITP